MTTNRGDAYPIRLSRPNWDGKGQPPTAGRVLLKVDGTEKRKMQPCEGAVDAERAFQIEM
jgi:hypothetical protein